MKTIRKRVLSLFTAMVMVCSLVVYFPLMSILTSAASNAEIRSKMISILYNNSGGYVSCDFDGYTTTAGRHEGIDCCKGSGSAVYSLINGEVIRVNNSSSLSTLAIYDSVNDKTVIYLHSNIQVANGTKVSRGQFVAYEDSRGASAAHTHVEVRNGKQQYAAKSVNDYTLENSNPYPYWGNVLFGNRIDTPVDNSYVVPCNRTASKKYDIFDVYGNPEYNSSGVKRYIAQNDNCTIHEVYGSGYVKVTYPIGNITHTAYARNEGWNLDPITPQGHVMSESEAAGKTIPDGDYWIFSELGLKTYLDIPGGDETAPSGTQITVYNYTDNMPKKFDAWTVTYLNNGFYKISQPGTNICLDVAGASLDQGTIVQTYTSNDTNAQQWSIRDTGHGYIIQSRANGYYLDVTKSLTDNGTKVITFGGDGTQKNQSWAFVPFTSTERPIADGEYYIKSATGNAWLDVSGDPKPKGNGYSNESNVQIWDSKTDSFNVKYISDGYYKIYETTSGLALDVYNPTGLTFGRGTNVQVYDGNNLSNRAQLWRIKDEGNGNYRLISNLNGYSLDVNGGLSDKGTNVQIWTYNTSNAQKWSFEKVHKHSYTSTVIASTCTEKGYTLHKCSCGDSYKDNYTDVISHNFGSWTTTKAATCAAEGTKTHKCSVCGKAETASIAKATTHSFGSWTTTKAATCVAEGQQTRMCSTCGISETKVITAIGHKYTDIVVEPTCTENGYTKHVCSSCGNTYTSTEVSANGHSYTVETIAPTDTKRGYDLHTCSVCNDSFKDNYTDPLPSPKVPELTATANEEKVTLKWKPIANAEKYGIAGYVNGKWKLLDECYNISYELKTIKPGTKYKVAVVAMFDSKWNLDFSNTVIVALKEPAIPKITYEKGNSSVKLTWTAVRTAEKYGIFEFEDDYWNRIAQTTDTSYVLNGLASGSEYKIAVVTYSGGKWNTDFSNAITVTPNVETVSRYPVVQTQIKDSKIGFKWNKVPGAEKYGIGIYQANKWKVVKQLDGSITTWTSPQLRNGTYRLVVLAKVNSEWDTSSINSRAFKVTIQ